MSGQNLHRDDVFENKIAFGPFHVGVSVVSKKHVEAVRAIGIRPETLAFAVGATPDSVSKLLNDPDFNATCGLDTRNDDLNSLLSHIRQYFANTAALEFGSVVAQLGSILDNAKKRGCCSSENDDKYVLTLMERLVNVNKLTVQQLAEFAGMDADALYGFAENPSSLSDSDKYHLAVVVSQLNVALNHPPPRSVPVGGLDTSPAAPRGLTADEMQNALEETRRPIRRPGGNNG